MKKVIIAVDKWLYGEHTQTYFEDSAKRPTKPGSMLYRPQDKRMCCVGMVLEQAFGKSKEDLSMIMTACDVGDKEGLPAWLLEEQNSSKDEMPDIDKLYTINDANTMNRGLTPLARSVADAVKTEEDRRNAIKEIFLKHNILVEFVLTK